MFKQKVPFFLNIVFLEGTYLLCFSALVTNELKNMMYKSLKIRIHHYLSAGPIVLVGDMNVTELLELQKF